MNRIASSSLLALLFLAAPLMLVAQEEVAEVYNSAVEKYKAKDYEGALEMFAKAIEVADPAKEYDAQIIASSKKTGSVLYYKLAVQKGKAKDYAAAVEMFEKAIEWSDPEDKQGATVIARSKSTGGTLLYYQGREKMKEDDNEGAIALFEQGMEWAPENYKNYYGKAQALEAMDKAEEAEGMFVSAVKAAVAEGEAEDAEKILIGLTNDKNWGAITSLADAFGEYETPELHFCYYKAFSETGDDSKAIAHIKKASEIAEEEKDKYLYYLAQAYEGAGDKANALSTYQMIPEGKYYESAQYKANALSGNNR